MRFSRFTDIVGPLAGEWGLPSSRRVTSAVHGILKRESFVAPPELFIEMGLLTRQQYEDWRFGRVPCLERVITCNLAKTSRIIRILRYHAQDRGLKPSNTVYKKWRKGLKRLLRFSMSGDPNLESAYATHHVAGRRKREQLEEPSTGQGVASTMAIDARSSLDRRHNASCSPTSRAT